MYYIGINCSGTYSRLLAVDEDGKVLGRHAGNSLNLNQNAAETVKENLKRLINEFNALTKTKLSDCKALCVGANGLGSDHGTSLKLLSTVNDKIYEMEKMLRDLEITCPIKVVHDLECALASETKGEPGILVMSTLNSVAYALDREHKLHTVGGFGSLIDESGSGYWIGMEAVKCVLMAAEGRIQSTILTEKIKEYLQIKSIYEITDLIYSKRLSKSQIMEIAILVKHAAKEDAIAKIIEDQASKALFSLVKPLAQVLSMAEGPFVLSGSIITNNQNISALLSGLIKKTFPKATVIIQKEKPEMGAVYLAMKG